MGRLVVLVRFGAVAWLLGLLAVQTDPGTVLVGVAAVVAAALLVRVLAAVPAAGVATLTGPVLRARSLTTAHHPQRDPDAAGRPRPRAPSAGPPTA
jgi:membrane-bound ClpP family serine protease